MAPQDPKRQEKHAPAANHWAMKNTLFGGDNLDILRDKIKDASLTRPDLDA